jgi:hypothetical protein
MLLSRYEYLFYFQKQLLYRFARWACGAFAFSLSHQRAAISSVPATKRTSVRSEHRTLRNHTQTIKYRNQINSQLRTDIYRTPLKTLLSRDKATIHYTVDPLETYSILCHTIQDNTCSILHLSLEPKRTQSHQNGRQ